MSDTERKITVRQAALNDIEARIVRVNALLNRIKHALERGDTERALNLYAEAQEANGTNRAALLSIGARDSIRGNMPAPPDDDDLLDTDSLDLSTLPPPSDSQEPE